MTLEPLPLPVAAVQRHYLAAQNHDELFQLPHLEVHASEIPVKRNGESGQQLLRPSRLAKVGVRVRKPRPIKC